MEVWEKDLFLKEIKDLEKENATLKQVIKKLSKDLYFLTTGKSKDGLNDAMFDLVYDEMINWEEINNGRK